MHSVTCSVFFSSFIKQSWISATNKAKLLEYKGRLDLCLYVSGGAPQLLLDEITHYAPKQPALASDWNAIFERVKVFEDDGHACKLVRALAHGEKICAPWEQSEKFRIKGDMWLKLGNMGMLSGALLFFQPGVFLQSLFPNLLPLPLANDSNVAIDSVEDGGARWVNFTGFDEAWKELSFLPLPPSIPTSSKILASSYRWLYFSSADTLNIVSKIVLLL